MKVRPSNRVSVCLIGSLLFAVAIPSGGREGVGLPYQDSDAYEVYAVLLPGEGEFWSKSKLILIQQETDKETGPIEQKECFQVDYRFQAKYAELLADYNAKNNQSWLLQTRLQIEKPYRIIPQSKFGRVSRSDFWQQMEKRFPDSFGYLTVSAVGFNKERNEALVEMSHACGNLCGGGRYHILLKSKAGWTDVNPQGLKSLCGWIS